MMRKELVRKLSLFTHPAQQIRKDLDALSGACEDQVVCATELVEQVFTHGTGCGDIRRVGAVRLGDF